MFDLRGVKEINLSKAECLKEGATYLFLDELTGKRMIAKLMAFYNDEEGEYLTNEFRKLVMLSGEPEIGTVYFLATAILNGEKKNCYVMNFIEGETLGAFLKRSEKISHEIVVDILAQIASGLEKAHHYEIFHSDLHDENIIIDSMRFVKLIDFAWFDYKMQAEFNFKQDVETFRLIVNSIFEKCDLPNSLLKQLCLSAENFNGLGKKILLINELASDWEMLSKNDRQRASILLRNLKNNYSYNSLLIERDVSVPDKFVPAIEEKGKKIIEKKGDLDLSDNLKRLRIDTIIGNAFLRHLLPLKQAGLLSDWKIMHIKNIGDPIVGPFIFSYWISYTPKFFTWKKISKEFNFLDSKENTTLLDLILH